MRLRTLPKLALFVLALLASTAAIAGSWKALLSPGPTAKQHIKVEAKCDSCHLVFKGIPDNKCLRCHKALADLRQLKLGYHFAVADQACIKCHTDHKGRDVDTTSAEAKKSFDHEQTRFPLGNSHADVSCERCHDKPLAKMEPRCVPCHEDPHESKLGANCAKCHAGTTWEAGLKTLASHTVAMDGGHTGLDCATCHKGGKHLKKTVKCASCHEESHGGTKADCSNCHAVAGWKPAKFDHSFCTCKFPGVHRTFECVACHKDFKFTGTPNLCSGCHAKDLTHDELGECSRCHSPFSWKKNRFDHNAKRSKFKLVDLHLTVDCARCHIVKPPKKSKKAKKRKKRVKMKFRGAPKTCEGCHLKKGLARHGDFGPCGKCHNEKGFDKSTFDHASTGFSLSGKHADAGCQDCHAKIIKGYPGRQSQTALPVERGPVRYASLGFEALARVLSSQTTKTSHSTDAPACGHCHDSPHEGMQKTDCASCHTADAWSPTTFDLPRHKKTAFPLKGSHQELDCDACHVGGQLKGLPGECAGCHVDVHQGKLPGACQDCHTEDAFSPVPGFDHKLTGFILIGKHGKLDCESCHGSEKTEDLTRRKAPRACATCHAPGHGPELGQACASCHKDSDPSFSAARSNGAFDHRKTGFSLERRHRNLKCQDCHPAAGPAPRPRCASCHVDPHAGQLTSDCAGCHRPDRWRLARFDHDRTAFPLRGRHHVTPCMSCHANQRWVGLTSDCFDCHALDAARAAQRVPEPHQFGRTDCTDCHFNGWRWRF